MADPRAAFVSPDDIRAAVASGLLKEGQAAALTALAHSRSGAREDLSAGDEPFELFKGFNEIFIMVGMLILSTGWVGLGTWVLYSNPSTWKLTLTTFMVVTVAMVWLMSEYFIRYRRMVGPAILLSLMFTATAAFGLSQWHAQVFMLAREDYSSLILPGLLTVLAVLIYWLRFKVPFAMALMALGLFATALLLTATRNGSPQAFSDLFVLQGSGGFGLITMALGLATFTVAMLFDGSDPHRVTRRSAQGFWLHLVAAPMIINTVALTLLARDNYSANLAILGLMAVFAIIAIVIDRRSFLLAAIAYTVSVILTLNPVTQNQSFAGLILALGVFLVLLGAFWAPIRAGLLRVIPLGRLRRFLPPAHQLG